MVGLDKSTYLSYVPVDSKGLSSKALFHTLFHILGRYHEHERPDRDTYIDFIRENIIEGTCMYTCMYNCHKYILLALLHTNHMSKTISEMKPLIGIKFKQILTFLVNLGA